MKKLLATLVLGLGLGGLAHAVQSVTVPIQFRQDVGPMTISTPSVAAMIAPLGLTSSTAAIAALGVSTGALRTDLNAETLARKNADYALGASTEATNSIVYDLGVSTDSLAGDIAIGQGEINALSISTQDIRNDLNQEVQNREQADYSIGASTLALNNAKANKAGDTFSGQVIFQSSVSASRIDWSDGSTSTTGNVGGGGAAGITSLTGAVTATGPGVAVASITNGAVDSNKLANGSVTPSKIAGGAVDSSKIAGGAVTASALATGAVETAKLGDASVINSKLADAAVGSEKLFSDSSSLIKVTGGLANMAGGYLNTSSMTITEIFRMQKSTPATYVPVANDIFTIGSRETNNRVGLQFFPPTQGGVGGILKLGMQMSGEGDPFDRPSDGIYIVDPTINRGARIKANAYRISAGNNTSARYLVMDETKIHLSTGSGANVTSFRVNALDGKAGFGKDPSSYQIDASSGVHFTSATVDGEIRASTFIAVGSAFIVGDSILSADSLSLGAGGPIFLDSLTGDITATAFTGSFSGNGGGITGLTGGNLTDAVPFVFNLVSNGAQFTNGGNLGLSILTGLPSSTETVVSITGKTQFLKGPLVNDQEYSVEIASGLWVKAGGVTFPDGTTQYTAASGGGAPAPVFSQLYFPVSAAQNRDSAWKAITASSASVTLTDSARIQACVNYMITFTASATQESLRVMVNDGSTTQQLSYNGNTLAGDIVVDVNSTGGIKTFSFCVMSASLAAGTYSVWADRFESTNTGSDTLNPFNQNTGYLTVLH